MEKKMGYFQNIEISEQVEEADRVPPPIPASRHLGHGTRKDFREIYNHHRGIAKAKQREDTIQIIGLFLTALILGFMLGVVLV